MSKRGIIDRLYYPFPGSDMAQQLDSQYFQILHQQRGDNVIYQVVRPLHSPIILFSTCDPRGPIPLASLHLLTQNYAEQNDYIGNRGRTLITQRWRKSNMPNCDFQGLITKDNQDYEFVITNLTTGNDLVNINILKENVPVREVDPGVKGHGLNQINELKSFQSIAIQCDQKDNRSLVLRSIKSSTGQHVTVEEDERQGPAKAKGTYYYLSVVGQMGTPTANLFKETVWSTVDFFINVIPSPNPVAQALRLPWEGYRGGFHMECAPMRFESATVRNENADYDDDGDSEEDMAEEAEAVPRRYVPNAVSATPMSFRPMSFMPMSCMGPMMDRAYTARDLAMIPPAPLTTWDEAYANDDDMVAKSHAATVDGGRHIDVRVGHTGITYDFDNPSAPCCLGLSICENMTFYPEPTKEAIMEEALQSITDYQNNNAKAYLARLTTVYKEDNCCLCLEEEPNVVMYQCGHQCCHQACLKEEIKKCPLCRQLISARIKI